MSEDEFGEVITWPFAMTSEEISVWNKASPRMRKYVAALKAALSDLMNDYAKRVRNGQMLKPYLEARRLMIDAQRKTEHKIVGDDQKKFSELVLSERDKGNVVFLAIDSILSMSVKDIVKQPADGLLWDLNRDEATALTFMDREGMSHWVNNFAVALVIRELKSQVAQLEKDSDDAWNVIKAAHSLEMLLDALGSRHSLRDAGPDLDSLTKTLEPFKERLEALLTPEEDDEVPQVRK